MFTPRTRTRCLLHEYADQEFPLGSEFSKYVGGVYPPNEYTTVYGTNPTIYRRKYVFAQRTSDVNHGSPPYKTGGPFDSWSIRDSGYNNGPDIKNVVDCGPYPLTWRRSLNIGPVLSSFTPLSDDLGVGYIDGFFTNLASDASNDLATKLGSDWGDVSSYGAEAWNKFKPGKSEADFSVFFGEIRETPKMLRTSALAFKKAWKQIRSRHGRSATREVANQHLNNLFGWTPFLSDIRKFVTAYQRMDDMLKQIKRDNGKWVRRRGTVHTSEDRTWSGTYCPARIMPLPGAWHFIGGSVNDPKACKTVLYRTLKQRVWFSGKFRYYIPDIEDGMWDLNARRKLFGATLTPGVVWNLIPWSWLVDWFGNIGDVLDNLDNGLATDLVAEYAYLMGTTTLKYEAETTLKLTQGTHMFTHESEITRKVRQEANPFGFGLTMGDLSPRRISILAALGISRAL